MFYLFKLGQNLPQMSLVNGMVLEQNSQMKGTQLSFLNLLSQKLTESGK